MEIVQEEDLYLGVVLNTKETLSDFLKIVVLGLLGDLSPMHRSRPRLGCDSQGTCLWCCNAVYGSPTHAIRNFL